MTINNKPLIFSLLGLLWFMLSMLLAAKSGINVLVAACVVAFLAFVLVCFATVFIMIPRIFLKWGMNKLAEQEIKSKELQRQMNRSGGHE